MSGEPSECRYPHFRKHCFYQRGAVSPTPIQPICRLGKPWPEIDLETLASNVIGNDTTSRSVDTQELGCEHVAEKLLHARQVEAPF